MAISKTQKLAQSPKKRKVEEANGVREVKTDASGVGRENFKRYAASRVRKVKPNASGVGQETSNVQSDTTAQITIKMMATLRERLSIENKQAHHDQPAG